MNFSFPPRPFAPERRRLLLLALLVLAAHGFVALLPSQRRPVPGSGGRIPIPADDTPELLRLSRASASAEPGRLSMLPLGALPPPPPSLLPKGHVPAPASAVPVVGLPAPALPARLADAASVLRTLQLNSPVSLATAAERDHLAALQRRQWWLSAAQEPLAQQLWQRAVPVAEVPEVLGALPEGGALRRVSSSALTLLDSGDWHGRSLLSRQGVLLIWIQAGQRWLLRLTWSSPETLTSS